MTLILALLLSLLPLSALSALELEAAIAAQERPGLWRAIHQVECSGAVVCTRSHAGACGPFQVLGGRYGFPPCDQLERNPWLAVMTTAYALEYWRRRCGDGLYLEAYHSGNPGCRGETDGSYTKKVLRWKKMFDKENRP